MENDHPFGKALYQCVESSDKLAYDLQALMIGQNIPDGFRTDWLLRIRVAVSNICGELILLHSVSTEEKVIP